MVRPKNGRGIALLLVGLLAGPAAAQTWTARLDGARESPPVTTAGAGIARITLDPLLRTLRLELAFAGLTGVTVAAHLHCCTASTQVGNAAVASPIQGFPGFPNGVGSGSLDVTLDLTHATSFSSGFVTGAGGGTVAGAYTALVEGLAEGGLYLNIHTTVFPAGEIRGFMLGPPVFSDGFE